MIINRHKVQLQNIPLLDKIGYGVNDMGIGVIYQVVAAYLVFYATSILMIPGSLVGLVVGISVIWDGVTDPFMGYLSDRTKTRHFGRRHPYIIIGGLGRSGQLAALDDPSRAQPDHQIRLAVCRHHSA